MSGSLQSQEDKLLLRICLLTRTDAIRWQPVGMFNAHEATYRDTGFYVEWLQDDKPTLVVAGVSLRNYAVHALLDEINVQYRRLGADSHDPEKIAEQLARQNAEHQQREERKRRTDIARLLRILRELKINP